MNQLISCSSGFTLVALHDTAFVLDSRTGNLCELALAASTETDPSNSPVPVPATTTATATITEGDALAENDQKKEEKRQKSEEELDMIHAVGIAFQNDQKILYCALARGDKSLSLYKIKGVNDGSESEVSLLPTKVFPDTVWNSSKRLSCLYFNPWQVEGSPGMTSTTTTKSTPMMMLLVGDLVGDAYAYQVEGKGCRMLLGHTASMLTGMCMAGKANLVTADRDEKIRISAFPQTVNIEGFLLGHEAYITAIDVATENLIITSSGDSSIKIWDLEKQSERYTLSFESDNIVPADISLNSDGTLLAVIFDRSKRLDIYRVNVSSNTMLELIATKETPSQPLGVRGQGSEFFYVIQSQPTFLSKYKVEDGNTVTEKISTEIDAIRKVATDRQLSVPDDVLERDTWGQIKLAKRHETRGPSAGDEPWNRVERVEIAKAAVKRHKKRRKMGSINKSEGN